MILTNSDFEWLFPVPHNWRLEKLKYHFFFNENKTKDYIDFPVLSLTMSGIKERDLDTNEGQLPDSYENYNLVDSSCLVFNPMDLISGWVDIPKTKGLISPSYRSIKSKSKDINIHFIKYFFQSMYKEKVLFNFGEGVHHEFRWGLGKDTLNNFFIPLPPMYEQNLMVDFINKKKKIFENLIKKIELKNQLLKEQLLIKIESLLINKNIKKIRLDHIVDLIKRPVNRVNTKTYNKIGMYNWGKGVFKYPSEYGSELGDSKFNYIKEGDLLLSGQFAWEGSVSLVEKNFCDCISSHRFHILKGHENTILNEYLWSYLISQEGHWLLNSNSFGSGGRNRPLNINKLLKEKIPVPPLDEQRKIKNLVIELNYYKKFLKRRIELIREFEKSLISEVVSGRRKVI